MEVRKWLRGGYTAEAAFLLPLGLGVILFLVSCALLLRDRVAACAWVHEAAQWEGFQKREEGSCGLEAEILLAGTEERVDRGKLEVTAVCRGDGQMLSSLVRNQFLLGAMHIEEAEKVMRIYGEQIVRMKRVIEGVRTGGSDLQEGAGT